MGYLFSPWKTLSILCGTSQQIARCGEQHELAHDPFYENFLKGKNTLLQKFSKIGLVAEKLRINFRGWEVRAKSNKNYFL